MNWGAAYYPFQILIGELPGNVVHKALRFAPNPSFTKQSGHMSQNNPVTCHTSFGHMSQTCWSHVTTNTVTCHKHPVTCHNQHGHMSQTTRSHVTNMWSHVTNMWSHVTNNPVTCHKHVVTCHTSFHTIAPNIHPYILSFHSHCKSFLTFFSFLHHINREKFITIFILRNRWWTEAWHVYLNTNPFSHTTLMRSSDAPSQPHRKPIAPNIHPYILSFQLTCNSFHHLFSFLQHSIREKFNTICILRNRWCTEMRPIIHFKY